MWTACSANRHGSEWHMCAGTANRKGLDIKEVKSKWVAKACVVLLLDRNKFLMITIQAAPDGSLILGSPAIQCVPWFPIFSWSG